MTDQEQTIYVTRHHQTGNSVLHLREDCPAFRADSTIVAKPRSVFPPNQPVCKRCSGEWQAGGGDKSHIMALRKAATEAADGS